MRYKFKGKHKVWFRHRWLKPGDAVELTEEEYERLAIANPLEPLEDDESDEGNGDDLEEAKDLLENGSYHDQRSFLADHMEGPSPSGKAEVLEALEAYVEDRS